MDGDPAVRLVPWSTWRKIGGSLHSSPAASVLNGTTRVVVARGANGSYYQATLVPGGSWAWTRIPGSG